MSMTNNSVTSYLKRKAIFAFGLLRGAEVLVTSGFGMNSICIPQRSPIRSCCNSVSSTNSVLRNLEYNHMSRTVFKGNGGYFSSRFQKQTYTKQSFQASAAASTTFEPAPPPGTKGTPMYPNILDTESSSTAVTYSTTVAAQQRNQDPNAVFVVTGASRGIGLQLVKSLIERTKGTIVACIRNPESSTELTNYQTSLNDASNRIVIVTLDIENQNSIEAACDDIKSQFHRIDLLLNVAGILGDGGITTPGPERALNKITRQWLEKTFAVNIFGPVMLIKELETLLVQKRIRATELSIDNKALASRPPSIVVNFSARVGSISDNELGGWYSYRMSKSALNQATRTMAIELKRSNVWVISYHPGTTNTDLSKPFQKNVKDGSLFPAEFTSNQLLNILDAMDTKHSGGFYDWAGQAISF